LEDPTLTAVDPSARSGAREEPKPACPECAALDAQLQELRISRDDALLALAKERELLEALRVKHSRAESYGRAEEPPLRYVIVDQLNQALKDRFQILHLGARRLTAFLLGSTKNQSRSTKNQSRQTGDSSRPIQR
jgi:hypothetical protein